jgi:hypothetical protein
MLGRPLPQKRLKRSIWTSHNHPQRGEKITRFVPAMGRHTTPSQAEIGARVRTRRYPHPYGTTGGGHFNRAAENNFRHGHRQYQADVIPVPLKESMRGDGDLDQGIPIAGAKCCSTPLAAQPQCISV